MRKLAISFALMMTLAAGVVSYAAMQSRPSHCSRTAAAKAARAAKQNGGARIVTAVDHGHHHHGTTGEVDLMQNVDNPIPPCYPCEPVGCECSLWDAFWHCSIFMS